MSLTVNREIDAIAYDEFVKAIANCMGWTFGSQIERIPDRGERFAHSGVYEIVFNLLDGDRMHISGMTSYCRDGIIIKPDITETFVKITVSTNRTPELIARDIKSRLLPKYQKSLDKAIAEYQDKLRIASNEQDFARKMAGKLRMESSNLRLDAKFRPNNTIIELQGLSDQETEELIELINVFRSKRAEK